MCYDLVVSPTLVTMIVVVAVFPVGYVLRQKKHLSIFHVCHWYRVCFSVNFALRLKNDFIIQNIIQHSRTRWQHSDR
jgi:hypothetical protein